MDIRDRCQRMAELLLTNGNGLSYNFYTMSANGAIYKHKKI